MPSKYATTSNGPYDENMSYILYMYIKLYFRLARYITYAQGSIYMVKQTVAIQLI